VTRLRRLALPVAIALLALALRALPWREVLTGPRPFFFGNDAWYHMRRVVYSLLRYPETLGFDPYVAFPEGARPIWPPLFDLAVATLLWPVHRLGGIPAAERVAAWVPPLLGAAAVLALHRVVARRFGTGAAAASALVLATLSAHFWYTQLGFLDHHAAVPLAALGLVAAAAAQMAPPPGARSDAPAAAWRSALLGLPLGGILLLWPGALLHVAAVEAGLLLHVAFAPEARAAVRRAAHLAASNALAFALVLPAGAGARWPQWSDWSPVVLSRFQPWLFALLALHAAALAALWRRRPGAGDAPARRFLAAAALGALLLAASGALLPELARGFVDALLWLTRAEFFQAMVSESRPLLAGADGLDLRVAELRLSRLLYLFPPAAAAMALWGRRRPDAAAIALFVGWAALLGAATLAQRRFFASFAVGLALVAGWAAAQGARALAGPHVTRRGRRAAAGLAVAALLAFLLAPTLRAYQPYLRAALAGGSSPVPSVRQMRQLGWLEAARWLADATPRTSGLWEERGRPEYGVLAPWAMGHILQYRGQRPAVVDNFGDDVSPRNFALHLQILRAKQPERAEALLAELRARYVLAEPVSYVRFVERGPEPLLQRLHQRDGAGLGGLRLVYETHRPFPAARSPRVKVFERVAGARVRGRAPPGVRVAAELSLVTNTGRRLRYRQHARANAEGYYALRLPYATRGAPPAVRVEGAYRVAADGPAARVPVPEAAVRSGRTLRGPDLATRGAAAPPP